MQLKTILGNVAGVLVGGWLVATLAPHIELIDIYSKAAYPAQVLMAFAGILISFALIIWLKETALRNQLHHATAAKTIFYPAAVVFLLIDVLFNICYSPIFLLGSTANSHEEGWTFTSHCKAVRDVSYAELEFRSLTRLETLRFKLALFYGRIMNSIDEGHF
jgi:hypothetical protein